MAGTNALDLMALANEFLAACEDSLNTIPGFDASLAGAPTRSFVAPGQPAADCCPQLTVHVVSVTEDQGGLFVPGRSAMTGRQNQVQLAMTLFRCAETEKPMPEVAELVESATQVNADGWALWNHLYNMIREGTLFSTCSEVAWLGLRNLQPEGGCVGWYLLVQVHLDGYEESASS